MLIDWFTVCAQAFNFLVLVWLLKRYLYQPILHAVDEREKRIVSQLEEAAAKKNEAQKEQETFKSKNEELEQRREALMSVAVTEAKNERLRLLEEARREFESVRSRQLETLESERHNLEQEIARKIRQEVFAVARKTLTDLADASLEERMVTVFLARLKELSGADKDLLIRNLASPSRTVFIHSAFDLPKSLQMIIESAVRELLANDMQVQFEVVPNLVSGLELLSNGYKVAWSVGDFLSSMGGELDTTADNNPR